MKSLSKFAIALPWLLLWSMLRHIISLVPSLSATTPSSPSDCPRLRFGPSGWLWARWKCKYCTVLYCIACARVRVDFCGVEVLQGFKFSKQCVKRSQAEITRASVNTRYPGQCDNNFCRVVLGGDRGSVCQTRILTRFLSFQYACLSQYCSQWMFNGCGLQRTFYCLSVFCNFICCKCLWSLCCWTLGYNKRS